MQIPLLDLKTQYTRIKKEIDSAVADVFSSQQFILGPKVKECEEAIARYCNCTSAVGVSSGTDAILSALMSEGIGLHDEVITTPYTFFATAGSIVRVGATPVFLDIDPASYNLDPQKIREFLEKDCIPDDKTGKPVNRKTSKQVTAVIPVHLYGQAADMDPIMAIAEKYNLIVIEDAAQALGAEYKGQRVGSFGHYGCFSFFPSKNLGGAGDGGMVVTNDVQRADRLYQLRTHGAKPKYYHKIIGGNFRLDALQAAIVLAKLPSLDEWIQARQNNAERYSRLFNGSGITARGFIELPEILASRHTFNQYVIRADRRDELRVFLKEKGISSEIYYPVPLHLQECFSFLPTGNGSCPESEKAACETIALPCSPELTEEQALYIVDAMNQFYL